MSTQTHAKIFQCKTYVLLNSDGHLVGQVVSGSKVFEIISKMRVNDNRWHRVYWEVNVNEMVLNVDDESSSVDEYIVSPDVDTWILGEAFSERTFSCPAPYFNDRFQQITGSRTEHGSTGFAGQIRNMYLNGNEIILRSLVEKQSRGMRVGLFSFLKFKYFFNSLY